MSSPAKATFRMNRRSFLQSTAALGAGLALAPTILGAEEKGTPKLLKCAIIGAGTQGRVLLDQCVKLQGLSFEAVCDIWPFSQQYASRRLQAYKHPARVYEDYNEMLDKEKGLDACIVATPDWMHAEHTVACLSKGINVYCEKEMSNSLEKAKQMVVAAKESGKLLQIGHQRRSNPRYHHCQAKLLAEANLLGAVTHIYGQWNRSTEASQPRGFPEKYALADAMLKKYGYDNMNQFRDWRWYKKYGGGPIVDLGSHQIDIFSWFLGVNPKAVQATGGLDYHKKEGWEWYDNVMAIYEYATPKGVVRAFYQTLTTTSARGYYETFMGDQGTLTLSEDPAKCRVYAEGHLTPGGESAGPHPWKKWEDKGYILKMEEEAVKAPAAEEQSQADAIMSVYKSKPPTAYIIPLKVEESYHAPHLQNFFDSVRGQAKLNCPAEIGYETAVMVLKVNDAVEQRKTLDFTEAEFKA
jgi:predicted dehydrogenase